MPQELPSNIRYDDNTKTYYFASEDTPGQYSLPEVFTEEKVEELASEIDEQLAKVQKRQEIQDQLEGKGDIWNPYTR